MVQKFNTDIAIEIGIDASIVYQIIQDECEHNQRINNYEREGHYWFRASIAELTHIIPYMSNHRIRTAIKTLEDKGYIISSKYNESPYDSTKWYTDIKKN